MFIFKEQQLWDACTSGDYDLVKLLANDSSVSVNWIGPESGDTPLHRAARFGHVQVVEFLLRRPKVEVNASNAGQATPFYIACQNGHKEVASLFLADPRIVVNRPNNNGATPFYIGCQQGHKQVVLLLLTDKKIDVNIPHKEGGSPFYIACQNGHKEVVSLLLADKRIDANKPNNNGSTPFFIGCDKGHKEVVSLLLADPRVDVTKPNNNEATPFFIACSRGHKEVVLLFLADMRIDISKPNNNQCTPLWFASQNGHLPVVRLLLASGREIDTKTKSIAGTAPWNNTTAAEVARWSGSSGSWKDEKEENTARRKEFCPLIVMLLDSYEQNPQQVRDQLRQQLGIKGKRLSLSSFAWVFISSFSFGSCTNKSWSGVQWGTTWPVPAANILGGTHSLSSKGAVDLFSNDCAVLRP